MTGEITYSSKQWLGKEKPVGELIRDLGYRLIGELDEDNYIVKRRGEKWLTKPSFHLLHISWGDKDAVQKYKLFRINVFSGAADRVLEEVESTLEV